MLCSKVKPLECPFAPFCSQFSFGASSQGTWAPFQQSLLSGKDLKKKKFTLTSKKNIQKNKAITAKFQKSIFKIPRKYSILPDTMHDINQIDGPPVLRK